MEELFSHCDLVSFTNLCSVNKEFYMLCSLFWKRKHGQTLSESAKKIVFHSKSCVMVYVAGPSSHTRQTLPPLEDKVLHIRRKGMKLCFYLNKEKFSSKKDFVAFYSFWKGKVAKPELTFGYLIVE